MSWIASAQGVGIERVFVVSGALPRRCYRSGSVKKGKIIVITGQSQRASWNSLSSLSHYSAGPTSSSADDAAAPTSRLTRDGEP